MEERNSPVKPGGPIDRRSLLRKGTFLTGGAALGSMATGSSVASDCGIEDSSGDQNEDDYVDKAKDSDYDEDAEPRRRAYRNMEQRSSIIYNFSEQDADGRWQHWFYGGSFIQTKRSECEDCDWYLTKDINWHEIVIENQDTSTADLYTTESDDVGGAPDDGSYDLNVTAASYTAAKVALSAHPYGYAAVGAYDICDALIEGDGDEGEKQTYNWDYDWGAKCEAAHYVNFMLRSDQNEDSCHFTIDYLADANSRNTDIGWNVYIDVWDDSNIESTQMMSDADYERHPDLVKVPTEAVPKHPGTDYPEDGVWVHKDPTVVFTRK